MKPTSRLFTRVAAVASLLAATIIQDSRPLDAAANMSLQFDGVNDYVTFGNPSAIGLQTFTLELWFRRDGAGVTTSTGTGGVTAVPLVAKGRGEVDGSNRDMNYFLGLQGTSPVLVADFEDTATGGNHPVIGTKCVCDAQWHHAAATYDGSTWRLYLDGVLDQTREVGAFTPRYDSIQRAALGSAQDSAGTAAGFFKGALDEVRIWNSARSASAIQSNRMAAIASQTGLVGRWGLDEGTGTSTADSSGRGSTGTLRNGPLWTNGAPLTTSTSNQPPGVNAGPDLSVTLPAGVTLSGQVTDDGLPGTPMTIGWSRISGPGTVTFAAPASATTTATFSAAGSYVLRLTANDGQSATSDDVAVQVSAAAINQPPSVIAGADVSIVQPGPVSLNGSTTDDGLPTGTLTMGWTQTSGPGVVTFANAAAASTTATFSQAGTYVLTLAASDGVFSRNDAVTVTVTAQASSNTALRLPGSGAYVTFGQAALGAAQFTLEAWFQRLGAGQTTSTGTGGTTAVPLVSKGRSESDGSNVDMNYFLGIDASGHLVADFEEGASGQTPGLNHPVSGSTVFANNTWYHVAATYDGTTWRLYVNGQLDGQLVVNRPPRSDSIQHAGIGTAMNSTGVASGFFNGIIDEVRIWNVSRTAQDIVSNMNAPIVTAQNLLARWGLNDAAGTRATDSSGRGIDGTIVGTSWSWVSGAPFSANTPPDAPLLVGPLDAATGMSGTPALNVLVGDSDQDKMTVTFFGRAVPTASPAFTLVAIPDTQHYVDSSNYPTFTTQTQWIVANRSALNIAFVTHLGDIVQNIDAVEQEWTRADTSMKVLDTAGMPYAVSPGNHDITAAGVANLYDKYFPVSRFLPQPTYAGWLGKESGEINRLNKDNYSLFSAGSLDFLIIQLEMDIPDYSLAWADKILKRYPNRRAIISTHIYLNVSGVRPTSPQFRSNGTSAEQVWQQLVAPNCNVFLVVNGHYHGEARRTDLNNCGQPVHQVVQDYQDGPNGGDGWLRYFTFKPAENRIYAYTYSPTRNGGLGEFDTDAQSQFTLDYAMQGAPFGTIGSVSQVGSGSSAGVSWPGLAPGTKYEWYATVSDGKTTTVGPPWTFTTQ